jgi:predicted nucleic acid-binding protein
VIYLDTSVVLAHLLIEDRQPPAALWDHSLASSRLLEYELWTRLHARNLGASHGDEARALLNRVSFVELAPPILARALEPWPLPLRTLDALHLASMTFLVSRRQAIALASYDQRQIAAARALGFQIADVETMTPPS